MSGQELHWVLIMIWKFLLNYDKMGPAFYKDKVVVITGGSSGIGLAVAWAFAKQKANVIIVGRNAERLQRSKKILDEIVQGKSDIMQLTADVANYDQINKAISTVGERFGKIDVLINCAGIITCGRFAEQSIADIEKCLLTNYLGSVYTTKAAWPWLKKAKGQLSFVSSVAGYLGLIGYSSYTPSKFALAGLAECLRMEAKDDGIKVSIIYPPDTDTPLLHYERQHTLPESIALSKNIKVISADKVAAVYLRGLQKNKFEIYCDFNSRFARWMKNNLPALFHSIIDGVVKKSRIKAKRLTAKTI